jgi:hypothetical protein
MKPIQTPNLPTISYTIDIFSQHLAVAMLRQIFAILLT